MNTDNYEKRIKIHNTIVKLCEKRRKAQVAIIDLETTIKACDNLIVEEIKALKALEKE